MSFLRPAAVALMLGGLAAGCKHASTTTEPEIVCRVTGVTLSNVQAQMVVGQSVDVQAAVAQTGCTPVPAATITSSDPSVVTVSGLTVTAVGVGQVTLTAQIQGRTETATAQVTVSGRVLSLGVTPATAALDVAATLQLTAAVSVDPGAPATVTWRTSDPAKATVTAAGLVTGVAAGAVSITAVATLDTTKKATAQLTVNPRVLSVTVAPAADSMRVADARTLVATVSADPGAATTVTWRSAAPSTASVAIDGTVTGVAPGTTTITAISTFDTTKRATATVKVVPRVIGITVTPQSTTVNVGAAAALVATVTGDLGVATGVTWTSSDPTKATVNANGVVTGVAPGTVTVQAAAVADPLKKASAEITVVTPPPPAAETDFCVDWDFVPGGVRAGAAAPVELGKRKRRLAAQMAGSSVAPVPSGCPVDTEIDLFTDNELLFYSQLAPTYSDLAATWVSSNPSIVAITHLAVGVEAVRALANGTVTLTGTAPGGRVARVKVRVSGNAPINTCLALSPTGPCVSGPRTVKVGQALDLYMLGDGVNTTGLFAGNINFFDWIPSFGKKVTIVGITAGSAFLSFQYAMFNSDDLLIQVVP